MYRKHKKHRKCLCKAADGRQLGAFYAFYASYAAQIWGGICAIELNKKGALVLGI